MMKNLKLKNVMYMLGVLCVATGLITFPYTSYEQTIGLAGAGLLLFMIGTFIDTKSEE